MKKSLIVKIIKELISESMPPKGWKSIDTLDGKHITITKGSGVFNLYRNDKNKETYLVNVNNRSQPVAIYDDKMYKGNVKKILTKVRKLKYKVSLYKVTADDAAAMDPGRQDQSLPKHGW